MNRMGTCHFVSKLDADRYCREQGGNADYALAEGSIQIGPPPLGPGQTLSVIAGEGRYQINFEESQARQTPRCLADEIALLSVDANRVILPKTHLSQYGEIKRMLETGGGCYNAKGFFAFPVGIDPEEILATMRLGKVLNGKKDSQSFFTPQDLGHEVCNAAGPLEGKRVLEPSAGDGALADIAEAAGAEVVVVENYEPNAAVLRAKGYHVIDRDFLTVTPEEIGTFDAIVANPPFSGNRDIEHILHMWSFLKPGGVLSAISSQSWRAGSQRKQRLFREFIESHQACVVEVPAGTFKESGTSVGTLHIRIQKPERVAVVSKPTDVSVRRDHSQISFAF